MRKLMQEVLKLKRDYGDIAIVIKPAESEGKVVLEAIWFDADFKREGFGFTGSPDMSVSMKQFFSNVRAAIDANYVDVEASNDEQGS